jgi:hypothetical protein
LLAFDQRRSVGKLLTDLLRRTIARLSTGCAPPSRASAQKGAKTGP